MSANNLQNPEVPAGIAVPFTFEDPENLNLDFSFCKATKRPLQPLTLVEKTKGEDGVIILQLSSIFFVDESITINKNNIQILQDFSYTNEPNPIPFLNFHICYNDKELNSQKYKGYKVVYNVNWKDYTKNITINKKPIPSPHEIDYVTTFLWDEDPRGSRGTYTTVEEDDE